MGFSRASGTVFELPAKYNKSVRSSHYGRRVTVRTDMRAVSEALGTILLLLISIALVSIVAVYLNSIPMEEETPQVELVASYSSEDQELVIVHRGGETLPAGATEIVITRNFVNVTRYGLSDGGLGDTWGIGDEWKRKVYGLLASEELEVMVIDTSTQTVILDQVVQEGTTGALVDLAIKDEEIGFTYESAVLSSTSDVNITVKLYNLGNQSANNIIIRFFAGTRIISYDSQEFLYLAKLDPTGTDGPKTVFWHWVPGNWGKFTINIKVYTTDRETSYANNYANRDINVEFTELLIQGKDLEISATDISFFPTNPTRGVDVQMDIRVHNVGDDPVRKGEKVWVRVYDITNGRHIASYNITNGISALGYHDWSVYWRDAGPGGTMNLSFEVDYGNAIVELVESNNLVYKQIQVMPRILLVDDDGWAGGEYEVRHFLSESLTASGVTYDLHTVVASDPNDPA